jgi:hypothetical protein
VEDLALEFLEDFSLELLEDGKGQGLVRHGRMLLLSVRRTPGNCKGQTRRKGRERPATAMVRAWGDAAGPMSR